MIIPKLAGWLSPPHLIHLTFHARPDGEFIISDRQRLTRRQAYANLQALAAGLQSLGVQKGDRVATLLPACPEAVYALFLPPLIGVIHVPLNPLLSEPELRHILADCGAKVVIVPRRWYGRDYPALLARLLPDLPNLRYVLIRDATDGDSCIFRPLAAVMPEGKIPQPVPLSPTETSLICYTAGTTGQPKGARHKRILGSLFSLGRARQRLSALRCLLLPFPPYNFAGIFGIGAALLAGGKVVLMERFDPERALATIQAERVTQIGGSPTMYRWLLQTPGQGRYDLSSVQRITSTSERVTPELAQAIHERFGCSLENFYGTTESLLVSWTSPDDPWERAATTIGRPVPGVEVRIVNEQRQPLPTATPGEIAVRAPWMTQGYHNAPELTAQVLDAGGWFYTGDIGILGDDGYLRLLDRAKDMIVRGGEKVYPAEVEQHLERHPLIRRAAVVGVPAGLGGEEVWAYVEPQPGARLTATEVLDFCRGQIAAFKIPDEVRFTDRLPLTAVGKVQKFKLRQSATPEVEAFDSPTTPLV